MRCEDKGEPRFTVKAMTNFALVATFNKKLMEMMDFLKTKYPDDRNVSYTRNQICSAMSLTPKMPLVHFMANVQPYLKQIKDKDDTFFLSLASEKYNATFAKFHLNDKWGDMNTNERDYIWSSVNTLATVGTKVLGF